ncbi:hypothetical protein AGMMS50230_14850 [Spirochaetia bacterium]|nr:hypothetical protein AGMMS50230_14850 [Spirochaetia bacterium]
MITGKFDRKIETRYKLGRFFENIGKLVLDAAKLSFGSLVLGTIIKGEIAQSTLLTAGIVASALSALIGVALVTIFGEK